MLKEPKMTTINGHRATAYEVAQPADGYNDLINLYQQVQDQPDTLKRWVEAVLKTDAVRLDPHLIGTMLNELRKA